MFKKKVRFSKKKKLIRYNDSGIINEHEMDLGNNEHKSNTNETSQPDIDILNNNDYSDDETLKYNETDILYDAKKDDNDQQYLYETYIKPNTNNSSEQLTTLSCPQCFINVTFNAQKFSYIHHSIYPRT